MWDLWSHVGLELPQDISGMVTRCHIESSLSSLEIDFRDSFEASFHVFSGFGRRFFLSNLDNLQPRSDPLSSQISHSHIKLECCEHPIHQCKKLLLEADPCTDPCSDSDSNWNPVLGKDSIQAHLGSTCFGSVQWVSRCGWAPVGPWRKIPSEFSYIDSILLVRQSPRSLITNLSHFQTPIQFLANSIIPQ